jgi:signal transduction histidine kinase
MNPLVNAAQAIERNGEIRIITKRVNNHINISISDNGSGIPEESIKKIFDPFLQLKR